MFRKTCGYNRFRLVTPPDGPNDTGSGTLSLFVATTGVDTNPGTQASPFRTITKAASVATPGTTVFVANGTYTGTFAINSSGSSAGYITYKSTNKWGARLVPPSPTSYGIAWNIAGDYIIIDGFDMDGQSTGGWRIGFWLTGNHIIVKNNHVHDFLMPSCDVNTGGGIVTDGSIGQSFHDVLNNKVHHIGTFGGAGNCAEFHGIFMQSYDWTVKNNLCYQISGDGINSYRDSLRGKIINNTVFHNGRGISCVGGGFVRLAQGGPFTINNNLIYDCNPTGSNAVGGILISGSLANNNAVNNNYFGDSLGAGISIGSGLGTEAGTITDCLPGFVSYFNDGNGDYHLGAGAICINAGTPAFAPSDDFDGVSRPQNGIVDIGCYEKV